MSSRDAVIGLDLGTSGLKVVVVDAEHEVLASATVSYDLRSSTPGMAEIDPAVWRAAMVTGIAQVLGDVPGTSIVGVGLDGQMHGLVAVGRDGEPVRPAMLWPDTRAEQTVTRWSTLPRAQLLRLANPLAPGMTGPMLAWLVAHEPETMDRVHHVVLPKDWLRGQLTGWAPVTDPSDASATLLWDMADQQWDHELCAATGIAPALLPEVHPSHAGAGCVTATAAAATSLPAGIPVSVGCADVAATMLGIPFARDRWAVVVGTGAQALAPMHGPITWPIRHHTYLAADRTSFAMAAVMNGGLALGRVCALMDASWEELYAAPALAARSDDDDIPVVLPYLSGERPPLGVTAGHGSIHGMGLHTTRADVLTGALEGVAFAIDLALSELPAVDLPTVDVTGGGAAAPAFRQLLADVVQCPVQPIARRDATAVGAAVLGWAVVHDTTPVPPTRVTEAVVMPRDRPALQTRKAAFRTLTTATAAASLQELT